MLYNNVFFIESDFETAIPGAKVITSPFRRHNKFKRLLVDLWYVLRLTVAPRQAIIIAPWGLFWAPGILKRIGLKKFKIISLSCDTFLSEKTTNNCTKGLIPLLKYKLAAYTHPAVDSFFFCSEVVHEQLIGFGVTQNKCVFQYREWVRDTERYQRFKTLQPSLNKNSFLFIGHCYSVMQKRVDLLVEAFLAIKEKYSDATLTVVGRGWPEFFGKGKIESLKLRGIIFTGETYNIDTYLENAAFYVHPGELEGFGLSVVESMIVGLIPLVSDKTGARDAVTQVDDRLIFQLSIEKITEKLLWAIALPQEERQALSKKARTVGATYRLSESVPALREELIKYINL